MASQLLDVFGFLSVLLRGGVLALNALVLGGVAFLLGCVRAIRKEYSRAAA